MLRRRIKGAGRKQIHVESRAVHVPIDIRRGGEIDRPGLHPALEARRSELSRISSVARCQRLKDMEGTQVARCPEEEGNDRQDAGSECETCGANAPQRRRSQKAPLRENDDRKNARNRQQRAIGPQQRGIAPGQRQQHARFPSRMALQPDEGSAAERNAEDGERLAQRRCDIIRGEGTQGRQIQRPHARALTGNRARRPTQRSARREDRLRPADTTQRRNGPRRRYESTRPGTADSRAGGSA